MKDDPRQLTGPQGGIQIQAHVMRRWRWTPEGELHSVPVRCKREQWYLARGFPADGLVGDSADVLLSFVRKGGTVAKQRVALSALAEAENGEALLGWVQAPEDATHLQVRLPDVSDARRFRRLVLHPVAERDPKCHPLANVPRWSSYRAPFPVSRVVLPASLEVLAERLGSFAVETIASPRSLRRLAAKAIGAACVIDPQWVRGLKLKLADLERLAAGSCLLVDLETFSALANRSGEIDTRIVTHTSEHDIMSAQIEYADVPTRGFALQDVIPYATLVGEAAFRTRVLLATQAWKRYAAGTGFVTLLASETPWEDKSGDVLSAARPVGQGELIASDLPWLVAGRHGRLLAPRLAEHLLRMHLGSPLGDAVQYWNRCDDCAVMVRDIETLARRYAPLHAVRWASGGQLVPLGITLPAITARSRARHLMICTGRIDQHGIHDGMPPEPMVIFMKWLAREARERTRWAIRFLSDVAVTWQFDTVDGLKYALHYGSAAGIAANRPERTLILRTAGGGPGGRTGRPVDVSAQVLTFPADASVFGDRALIYQAALTRRLRRWIEQTRR